MKSHITAMSFASLWTILACLNLILAQTVQYCPSDDSQVCYSVNVPAQTASSGTGDIYFQIKGPASRQWIALGQGKQMAGANIFIVYANAAGTNVTLSPRLGKGNVQPNYNSDAQVFLLDGTGIENGVMTANVRCSSCSSWTGGNMDLKSSSASWIWAVKSGSPIASDSPSANLQQHNKQDSFTFDLTKAQGGSSLNPFKTSAAVNTSSSGSSSAASGASTGTTTAGASSSGSSSGEAGNSESGDGDMNDMSGDEARMMRITIAHGVLMSLAFVIVYPLGSIIIRVLSFSGLVWVHAGIQWLAYFMALAGMGLGAYIGSRPGQYQLDQYHPVIGFLVLGLLLLQPPTGIIHHKYFKRHGKANPLWSWAHVINGRLAITLGIINGGLGLMFAANTTGGEIAYGVVAGIIWIVWMAIAIWGTMKGKKGETVTSGSETEPKPVERDGSN